MHSNYYISKIIFFLLVMYPFVGYSKQEVEPKWIKNTPCANNNTYEFKTFMIQSRSLREAKLRLPDEVAYYMERNFTVKGVTIKTTEVKHVYNNGKLSSLEIEEINDTVYTAAEKVDVKLRVIDEYKIGENVYFLCAIPNLNAKFIEYDKIAVTSSYGGHGVWRSAIVPGWGQLYKGSKLKGGLIMGGTVATIGGIIVTDCVRSDYVRKISKTKSVEIKRAYATKADHYAMGRNVCIGALAALYIYNIIDAAVAPGARRVVVKDRKDRRYSFLPSTTDDGGPALSAFMRF